MEEGQHKLKLNGLGKCGKFFGLRFGNFEMEGVYNSVYFYDERVDKGLGSHFESLRYIREISVHSRSHFGVMLFRRFGRAFIWS